MGEDGAEDSEEDEDGAGDLRGVVVSVLVLSWRVACARFVLASCSSWMACSTIASLSLTSPRVSRLP